MNKIVVFVLGCALANVALAADININFRATNAGAYANIDAAGQTYDIGANDLVNGGVYPHTRAGMEFGWNTSGEPALSNGRDRDNTNDPRLAGITFQANTGTVSTWCATVVSGHTYNIYAAFGDPSSASTNTYAVFQDDTTGFSTLNVAGGTAANEWLDATGTLRNSDATWISSNAAISRTFTSAKFCITIGTPTNTADVTAIAHISLTDTTSTSGLLLRRRRN